MKKIIIPIILLLILSIFAFIGTTNAYFVDGSKKQNRFAMSDGVDILLAEPKWDNLNYDGEPIETNPENLGMDAALNIVQSRVIPKNPSIKNNSSSEDAWVALKLEYYKITTNSQGQQVRTDSSYEEIDEIAEINWINSPTDVPVKTVSGSWITVSRPAIQTNTVFYYDTKIPAQMNTIDLFDRITIQLYNHSLDETGKYIYDINGAPVYNTQEYIKCGDLFQFEIVVKAYGIQGDNVDFETSKAQLYELMDVSP